MFFMFTFPVIGNAETECALKTKKSILLHDYWLFQKLDWIIIIVQ